MGHIYLLRTRECVRLNECTYKVGRSAHINNRINSYGNGVEIIILRSVRDEKKMEKQILKRLSEDFKQMKIYGNEYFQGNISDIVECVNRECDSEIVSGVIDDELHDVPVSVTVSPIEQSNILVTSLFEFTGDINDTITKERVHKLLVSLNMTGKRIKTLLMNSGAVGNGNPKDQCTRKGDFFQKVCYFGLKMRVDECHLTDKEFDAFYDELLELYTYEYDAPMTSQLTPKHMTFEEEHALITSLFEFTGDVKDAIAKERVHNLLSSLNTAKTRIKTLLMNRGAIDNGNPKDQCKYRGELRNKVCYFGLKTRHVSDVPDELSADDPTMGGRIALDHCLKVREVA